MNERKLRGKIVEAGYTHEELAKEIGIGAWSFSERVNGKKEFLRRELSQLKTLLHLNEREFIDIFFAEVKD